MNVIGTALEFTLIYQDKRISQQNVNVAFDKEEGPARLVDGKSVRYQKDKLGLDYTSD